MVNDHGQLYTIEGVAAAILMVVTAYLAVSSTTILTFQDVHIVDMQLQQLGSDTLAVMDTPDSCNYIGEFADSDLEKFISTNDSSNFKKEFTYLLNSTSGNTTENFRFNADIYFRNPDNTTGNRTFSGNNPDIFYRENAVKVSRWVYLKKGLDGNDGPQSVLLEVLLWRA